MVKIKAFLVKTTYISRLSLSKSNIFFGFPGQNQGLPCKIQENLKNRKTQKNLIKRFKRTRSRTAFRAQGQES